MIEQIKKVIQEALKDAVVEIRNPSQDGTHLEAVVISSLFKGKSLLEQHQMVMEPLKELFHSALHALSLKTYTPDEYARTNRS